LTWGKKALGPNSISALVISLLWDWDEAYITVLIWLAIHLSTHPWSWKKVEGVTIPKPGKPSYSTVESYWVISLLNCMGKLMEKVVAEMLSLHCEGERGGLQEGQYGCHKGRSTIDTVGILVGNI
jgi:hypothetical protein